MDPQPLPATGPLQALVLAPGSRPAIGKLAAGPGPTTVDFRLTPEPWKTTEVRLIDHRGLPVPDAEVGLAMGFIPWGRPTSDAQGRCRVSMAAGQSLILTIRRDRYRPAEDYLRGTDDEPTAITVALREPIRGRVMDPQGRPMSGIQVDGPIGTDDEKRLTMFPDAGSDRAVTTDEAGRFLWTPTDKVPSRQIDRPGTFRTLPESQCFADEEFSRLAFRIPCDMGDGRISSTGHPRPPRASGSCHRSVR